MKLISYNLHHHNAAGELAPLAELHDPDALCLQEADTESLPTRIGDLELVQSTSGSRLGLAVYLRPSRFDPRSLLTMPLEKSLHDVVMKPGEERLATVLAHDNLHGGEVMISSFHAAPLTASNSLRRQQVRTAVGALHDLGPGLPSVMAGDFNYPLFQSGLAKHVVPYGYTLSSSDSATYRNYGVFRGSYDLALSHGYVSPSVTSLPQDGSDHFPILVETSLPTEPGDLEVVPKTLVLPTGRRYRQRRLKLI
ncbi:MAG: endonuclease/exonuclease/phosphatase family protein [Corynebacterium sp.]|uniref:Endonuclease/exonuclease/phosphatase family protein n=1 Tax=Candidatus Corynebacterium faecigallinarum TaxID=2838528 RepID=A0A9D2QFJ8_9CORY|nr:endonuclease/exonuclease/phosphatase family protein [Corynebacterium sp.]HJC85129.1 endonuclease/exonuclease/phosphatase family protein [Candidatus Corynebacterium faecigallinarum]MDN5722355.1 endonuclease/exonuclease/phosphatase family protein [Corynebacterium sp.]MDN6281387.1 endonuclease/exonuclease/phosphatase family protein [Corynebacterium sp.]MDN6304960.1 endonuclease/exonuclease/phosphatase family protein [Corynebacterium sp.]MDN6367142.1 endonuclease/exonuclease/phosphatase family 